MIENPSNLVVFTGRLTSFLESPEKKIYPYSCTIIKHINDIETILFTEKALRAGCGVKVCLDEFVEQPKIDYVDWGFYIDNKNPDYNLLSEDDKQAMVTPLPNDKLTRVLVVNDSMDESGFGKVSIRESWKQLIEGIRDGYQMIVDLSDLRPKGSTNALGLVSSGAASFLAIYKAIVEYLNKGTMVSFMKLLGTINSVIRRGGLFKNGIVTFSYDYRKPYVIPYLNCPLSELPGSGKKSLRVDSKIIDSKRLINLLNVRINDASMMVEKIQPPGKNGEELYSNVCLEILQQSKGLCTLSHVNLGMCVNPGDIITGMIEATKVTCDIYKNAPRLDQFLPSKEDKQVGVGVVGLANLLVTRGIKYHEFIRALCVRFERGYFHCKPEAVDLVDELIEAFNKSSELAKTYGLERVFTIAPTQTCAYKYRDGLGNTTCKNINPPLSKVVQRKSMNVEEMNDFYNHGEIETIADILASPIFDGIDNVQLLWELWQTMMNDTGMAHTMSFDLYTPMTVDRLKDFLTCSPLQTIYYNFSDAVDQSYLDKGNLGEAEQCTLDNPDGCMVCAE